MFYTYRQNNTGGMWHGPAYVIVEADSRSEADELATLPTAHRPYGLIYFNGTSTGKDCSCCGDRWYRQWEDGTESPEVYGEPAFDEGSTGYGSGDILLLCADGTEVTG